MKLPRSVAKLVTNKYVLYLVAVLAFFNIFGYMMMGNTHALVLFILIGLIMINFSKNMTIVLLVPLILVSIYNGIFVLKEGLESMDKDKKNGEKKEGENKEEHTKEGVPEDKNINKAKEDAKKVENEKKTESFEGAAIKKPLKGSRIDYGTTVENAYDDLNKILGSDGIQKLTQDTQKLMQQQVQLAEAMQNMGGVFEQAKGMLKSLDMKGISDIGNMIKGLK